MKKLRVALVRGKHLNPYELQTYSSLTKQVDFVGFSSFANTFSTFPFPVERLFSPIDLVGYGERIGIPYRLSLGIVNRLFIDAHFLLGLESKLEGFDIAHTADTYYHFTQQCLRAKKQGFVKKVVATVWENIPFNNEGIWGRRSFKQRAIREVDHFIATTKQARDTLITEGCDPDKITVIYPGIDLNRFKPRKLRKDVKQILFVGRLVKEKGIWTIFEAFKQLYETFPDIKLRYCGDGEEKQALQKAIAEAGLVEAVSIMSAPYDQMPQVYHGADIFVLASHETKYWKEQFGMVLVEAMASWLPIVATNTGAIPEVVGEAGIIIKPEATELKNSLEKLISDPQLRLTLRQKAELRAKRYFDQVKNGKQILDLFQNLI